MAKKLKPSDFEAIISILSTKERNKLRAQHLSVEWLEENIERCKNLMKRDVYIGIPWFVAYTISLWQVGYNNITAVIFVIGIVYFIYTTFTTGSYGTNQRRVKVYEDLLKKLK
ncbi:MAG: hypothetical protein R2825_29405 [Saprospiraceae bacterium]